MSTTKSSSEHTTLLTHLAHSLFNWNLRPEYHPTYFRQSITTPLKKPGEHKIGTVAAIALLNTLGKVFGSIMATRISYLTETEVILPPNHIGGSKCLAYEVALHMTSAIHKA
jgi:hypothetical protein